MPPTERGIIFIGKFGYFLLFIVSKDEYVFHFWYHITTITEWKIEDMVWQIIIHVKNWIFVPKQLFLLTHCHAKDSGPECNMLVLLVTTLCTSKSHGTVRF